MSTQPTDRPRSWLTPELLRVLGAAASWGFAFSSFYLLPKFLAQELGAGPREIGAVVGVFGFATVAVTALSGRWVDRVPRHWAVAAGAALMALSALGFLGVHSIGYAMAALRVLQGASYALVVTAVGALVADLVPGEHLSHALGLSGSSMLAMNAIAPAVVEPLADAAGWPAVFLVAALAAAAAAVLAAGVVEGERDAAATASTPGMLAVLRQPLALQYAGVIGLAGAAFGTVATFEPPYVLALGATQVRGFFIAFATSAIFVRLFFGSLPDRCGRHRVAVASLSVYALVVLGMAAAGPGGIEILGAVFGLAHGLFFPSLNALVVTAVRPDERGRIMAIFTGSYSLGVWAGTTALGEVAEQAGYPTAFTLAALGTAGAVGILATSRGLRAGGRAPVPLRAVAR